MGRKKNSTGNSEYYVDPKELEKELRIYKNTHTVSEKLGNMILNMAKRYASKPCFYGYSYKNDFISSAVERVIEQLDMINIDHAKSNPFSYITWICHNQFIAILNKEKKYQDIKTAVRDHLICEFEVDENLSMKSNNDDKHFIEDNI